MAEYTKAFVDALEANRQALLAVSRQWERLHKELVADNARLRALISWVDGMLLDESAPMVIREGIYTALEAQK